MKKEEKPSINFIASTKQHPGAITQVLANGNTVELFQEIDAKTPRRFGAASRFKHPRSHLRVDTASDYIHQIATQVAQAKPTVVAESSLKDINNEYISNINNFTKENYQQNAITNHIMRLSPPQFMTAPMFRRDAYARSANQQKRWDGITAQRQAEIETKKQQFKSTVEKLAAYEPLTIQSTNDAPIDFSNDMGLKFRVIDAVIKHTKIQVPSSALATIHNVTQLADFVINKRNELEARASVRKNQERLPANVTYVYTGKIDRSKKPTWEKYQAERQKSSVATADV
jgi:hypothetical protein